MKAIKSIYLAGKIGRNDWRHDIVTDLRGISPQDGSCGVAWGLSKPWPILSGAIFDRYDYTGPYFISDDHGCFHGEDSHGVGADERNGIADEDRADKDHPHNTPLVDMGPWVVERCQQAIQQSDLIFAWIDDPTCYGTVAELGYAKALGKAIWIVGPKRYRDLWFIYEMADVTGFVRAKPAKMLKDRLEYYAFKNPHFDSPIEQAFWDAWMHANLPSEFTLVPQYPIGKYRVDFAHIPTKTAIELDGHATHSSPDAIAYDRKRQREIEEQGWHVIRFGGKEIFLDAGKCGQEAFHKLLDRTKAKVQL